MSIDFHHIISIYICQYLVCFVLNFAQFKVTVPMFELSTLSTLWPPPCHRKMMSIVCPCTSSSITCQRCQSFHFYTLRWKYFLTFLKILFCYQLMRSAWGISFPVHSAPAHAQLQVTFKNSSDRTPLARYILYLESFKRRFAKVSKSWRRAALRIYANQTLLGAFNQGKVLVGTSSRGLNFS